ncbi:cytochrome P450 [Actinopolyspora mortivallis]|uniref:Cytochrome P450 n=1 Tax=Actinopolyspora mortivallis TaxID=33906 RepID=A0A2T0GWL3_ACTMO|nr:cytochrome P450 [Actinopolyspora mortivallis]PRW63505.1 hypothetical protein CEP50_09910 [Actinopolyspora mortivallis]
MSRIPGPNIFSGMFALRDISKNPLKGMTDLVRNHGDLVRVRTGKKPILVVNDPTNAKNVLSDDSIYVRTNPPPLRKFLSGSLLLSRGEDWEQRKRSDGEAFTEIISEKALKDLVESADYAIERFGSTENDGGRPEILEEFRKIMFRMTSEAFLRTRFTESETETIINDIGRIEDITERWSTRLVKPSKRTLRQERKETHEIKKRHDSIILPKVASRIHEVNKEDNLISILQKKNKKDGNPLPPQDICGVLGNLIAGERASSIVMTWILHCLSLNPRVQLEARKEINRTTSGKPIEEKHLKDLEFLDHVVEETLRLYPPTWKIFRATNQETRLQNHLVPPGTLIMISPYLLHRNPRYWSHPDDFYPERFSSQDARDTDSGAYMPFGFGPRACLGKNMAFQQLKIITSLVVQKYDIKEESEEEIKPSPGFYLNPDSNPCISLEPVRTEKGDHIEHDGSVQ